MAKTGLLSCLGVYILKWLHESLSELYSSQVVALVEAEITTSGSTESFLSASVTRTRQTDQITASCLYKLLKEAYKYYCDDAILSFNAWWQKRLEESPQFHFWLLMLFMELIILSLVREANFT